MSLMYMPYNRRIGVGMKALKFTLKGKTAFFKKPDVNTYYYFTYGHIHKIALMGIFGAIMGYGGYNQQIRDKNKVFPEFYEKLKDIRVSIVPELQTREKPGKSPSNMSPVKNNVQKGYFNKKMQSFNNTVGYANTDGNLIISEQWLEDPCWDIFLMLKGEIEEEIANQVLLSKTAFIPYLGKNDHLAVIEGAEIVELKAFPLNQAFRSDSLYLKDFFKAFVDADNDDEIDFSKSGEASFKYEERLPMALEETTNQYITKPVVYTNGKVLMNDSCNAEEVILYQCGERCLNFF